MELRFSRRRRIGGQRRSSGFAVLEVWREPVNVQVIMACNVAARRAVEEPGHQEARILEKSSTRIWK